MEQRVGAGRGGGAGAELELEMQQMFARCNDRAVQANSRECGTRGNVEQGVTQNKGGRGTRGKAEREITRAAPVAFRA